MPARAVDERSAGRLRAAVIDWPTATATELPMCALVAVAATAALLGLGRVALALELFGWLSYGVVMALRRRAERRVERAIDFAVSVTDGLTLEAVVEGVAGGLRRDRRLVEAVFGGMLQRGDITITTRARRPLVVLPQTQRASAGNFRLMRARPRERIGRTRRATRAGPSDDDGESEPASSEVGG